MVILSKIVIIGGGTSGMMAAISAKMHYKNDEVVQLTTGEFSLLKILLQNPNQPLSRDKLMSLARGRGHGPFDRAIDVQISRLRKLIEKDPTQPRYLQTVWGFGYVFIPEENQKQTHSKK